MTDEDIKQARAIIAAATPGPWTPEAFHSDYGTEHYAVYPDGSDTSDGRESDASFIAAARTGWPAALDALESARRELAAWKRLHVDGDQLDEVEHRAEKAEADRDRLAAEVERLRKVAAFAEHAASCPSHRSNHARYQQLGCTCGLDGARRENWP